MVDSRPFLVSVGAAVAAALLLASATGAATRVKKKRSANRPVVTLVDPNMLGSFTPASSSPAMAAALARDGLDPSFRFTPSLTPGGRRAVTVAVRAQSTGTPSGTHAVASMTTSEFMPSAYSLGVAVGWRRFAISGDYVRVAPNLLPDSGHEAADVSVSYLGHKWRTTLMLGGERNTTPQARLLDAERSYSVDLGGAYELTRNFALSGGVRYQIRHDQLLSFSDDRRDSQAVYVGTAFKF